ncbi:MAG: winged helix-turn-helix transcriptional regulator [Leptolyngbya sp. BL-A-14]
MSVAEETYGCPVEATAEVIDGKWKCVILWWLRHHAKSFGELKRLIPRVSHKVLTQQLRELERDRLIHRQPYREAPPRVEYSLTPRGETLRPITEMMYEWGKTAMPEFRFGILRLDGVRVLLLEDNREVSHALCTELELRGIQVMATASVSEALAWFSQTEPDVLLVNTELANEDAYAFIRQMRETESEAATPIPAIALMPAMTTSDRNRTLREGFQVRLMKPVDFAELVGTIASLSGYQMSFP